jgi:hypothetical protein
VLGMTVLYFVSGGSGESGHCPLSPEPYVIIGMLSFRMERSGMRNLMLTGLIKMAIQIGKAE